VPERGAASEAEVTALVDRVEPGDLWVNTHGASPIYLDWQVAEQAALTKDQAGAVVPGRWFQTWYSPGTTRAEATAHRPGCGPTTRTNMGPRWRPMIFLTNAATVQAVKRADADPGREMKLGSRLCVGRGRAAWTIMCQPRPQYGETLDGRVWVLAPDVGAKDAVKAGTLSMDAYREQYLGGEAFGPMGPQSPEDLAPRWAQPLAFGQLSALPNGGGWPVLVRPGDTLCCSCGREKAREGKCHRVWAADLLRQQGWYPVLDGEPAA